MPTIKVCATDFKGTFNTLNKTHELAVSRLRCQTSAANIGVQISRPFVRKSAAALAFGYYKALAMRVAIDFSYPTLRLPAYYRSLDSTEKVNIAYWLGMTFATIYADDILKVAQLHHAASMKRNKRLTTKGGRSLADLVGKDASGQWHVIEAKGRQQEPSSTSSAVGDWKTQAGTITQVDGVAVSTNSYALCLIQSIYKGRLVDPAPRRLKDVELVFPDGDASRVQDYYGAYLDYLSDGYVTVRRGEFSIRARQITFDLVHAEYVFVGMEEEAYRTASRGEMPPYGVLAEGNDYYLGSDGIATLTSPTSRLAVEEQISK